MNVACPFKPNTSRQLGMDRLLSQYRRLGAKSFGPDFLARLEDAALQLEHDLRWNARLTDLLAVALAEAADEFRAKGWAEQALARLAFLYHHGKAAQDLEENWTQRMEALPLESLESALTRDLERAFQAAAKGKTTLVAGWLEQTEAHFMQAVERYESLSITQDEVTTESVLGHRLLQEGIESWLEALALFQEGLEGELDQGQVRHLARQGQRRLKFVESLKKRSQSAHRRYFANYN